MHFHAYVVLCLYAGLLSLVRVYITGDMILGWLIWNLILAVIPYFFAMMAVREKWFLFWVYFLCWLFFFPNALYIFTDFIHLGKLPEYIHFDIVLISTMALAGLISGFASLEIMHTYWNKKYHHVRWWIYVTGIMILSIFGVYLGRFLRFNSWDILHDPMSIVREMFEIIFSPNSLPAIDDVSRAGESLIFGAHPINLYLFISLYLGLYMILYVFVYHTRKTK